LPPWPRRGATSSSPQRVEGYRNFGTKLWNAARFAEMNGAVRVNGFDPAQAKVRLNRWIAGEVSKTRDAVTAAIEEHRYNEAAGALYSFTGIPSATGMSSCPSRSSMAKMKQPRPKPAP
jgi:valyl-tRNA synthetase